jgi:GNAT superfamily N-acetyltransferase
MPGSYIKAHALTGSNIQAHLNTIAKLRVDVLREYPNLYAKDVQTEKRHLKKYIHIPEAVIVIISDCTTLVGAAGGLPLLHETKEIQKPFAQQGWDLSSIFYFEECMLLKSYRGRGIGHHFFDIREKHALSWKTYQKLCFFSVNRREGHPGKPKDYLPLDSFWLKQGFRNYPEIAHTVCWKDIGDPKPTEKSLTLWVKELKF